MQRATRALDRQSRLPADDFGGLSGDAYRRHTDRSSLTAAALASDLALLAGALAALGRGLEAASVQRAHGWDERADEIEHRVQQDWRTAVARFEGREYAAQDSEQPEVAAPVTEPRSGRPPSAGEPAPPAPSAPSPAPAAAAAPATAVAEPALTSALVVPPPLESELVTLPVELGTSHG